MRLGPFLRDLIRTFPGLLALSTLLIVLEALAGVLSVFSIVAVIDLFMHPDLATVSGVTRRAADLLRASGLPVTVTSVLGVFLALQLVQNAVAIVARYVITRTRYAMLRELMLGTFTDLFAARWLFFTGTKQGTIINTFIHELAVVGDAFKTLALLFAAVIQLGFYLAVPFYLSWQVTLVSVAAGAILALPVLALGNLNYRLGQQATASANAIGAVIQEGVTLAKVIFGFGNQARSRRDLAAAFEIHQRAMVRSLTLRMATPLVYEPLGMAVLVVTLFMAQRLAVPLSEIAALVWALNKGVALVGDIAARRNTLENFLPSYEQVRALRERARACAQPSGGRPCPPLREAITLEHVWFGYPAHEATLVDVSLRVPRGQVVALVGGSGAGKSTVIDVIMGFNEPDAGRVAIDGVPLGELDIQSYRGRIGYVPQESILFNASIAENLRWANDGATDAEIHDACRRANASEFIERFPAGYETVVGDRGVRLSGGQCQRIALARAILRKPDLLILDEATSSLDSQSERLIQEAVESIAKDTTVVVVTHRLSTIVNADYIYVLDDGRVIEEGTYQSLLARSGAFSSMAQLQVLETAP